jgi:hypothetical protein
VAGAVGGAAASAAGAVGSAASYAAGAVGGAAASAAGAVGSVAAGAASAVGGAAGAVGNAAAGVASAVGGAAASAAGAVGNAAADVAGAVGGAAASAAGTVGSAASDAAGAVGAAAASAAGAVVNAAAGVASAAGGAAASTVAEILSPLIKGAFLPISFMTAHTYILLWLAVALADVTRPLPPLHFALVGAIAFGARADPPLLGVPHFTWGAAAFALLAAHTALQRLGRGWLRWAASSLTAVLALAAFSSVQGPALDISLATGASLALTAASNLGAAALFPVVFTVVTYAAAALPVHFTLKMLLSWAQSAAAGWLPPPLLWLASQLASQLPAQGVFRGPLGLVAFAVHFWYHNDGLSAVGRCFRRAHSYAVSPCPFVRQEEGQEEGPTLESVAAKLEDLRNDLLRAAAAQERLR